MIGDAASILPHPAGQLRLGQSKLCHEALVSKCPVNRVEILPLNVFDQRHLSLLEAVGIADDRRHFCQTGDFRRPPTALAGDELILLAALRTMIG